jgi:aspartyl protease family protein
MREKYLYVLAVLLFVASQAPVHAVDDITVFALFKDKAVLQIDGKRRVINAGETSPEGVRLVSADSDEAVLEVDGQRSAYPLGSHISTGYKAAKTREVTIWSSNNGMYRTTGSINGRLIEFLVDTGATFISLNEQHARKLGLDYRFLGRPVQMTTASGITTAYHLKLDTVKVGEVALRNVDAVIHDGPFPDVALLGMSFVGRLDMQRKGQALILKKKF